MWAMSLAGTLQLPEELELAVIFAQLTTGNIPADKSKLEQFREEKLDGVLYNEVNEAEPQWIDYELEETQVMLDLADMILEQLTSEAVSVLISVCLLYTSPSPRDLSTSRMPSSA
eukprot:TRINITY_DN11330_c0_g1_i1.p1 TRINITY_DN11330_c0_g1~~TRINITY_DN11330_c0_g1_i1.p1  ORF type:complete len:115 (-),score=25.70 TRINITY_DN11330_c0_g1_i1:85-429(-)